MKLDIADFAAFCRSKGDSVYRFTDNCGCALATYLQHEYGRKVWVDGFGTIGWWFVDAEGDADGDGERFPFSVALEDALAEAPHTFAALAGRLGALAPTAPSAPTEWTRPADYLSEHVA